MISLDVLAALFNENTGRIEVVKEVTNDDGTIEYAGQDFHPETLEWWAAVYGIDDINELIELVVLEPHLENINPMEMSRDAAKTLQREKVAEFKKKHPKVVKTKGTAKLMLSESPLDKKYANAANEDPFEVIKRLSFFDPEIVQLKKQHIERIRKTSSEKVEPKQQTRKERMEQMTNQLNAVRDASNSKATEHKTSRALPVIELGKKRTK